MKLMIMNYKPYEYELLQEKLDELGQAGYTTDELALITFFKKVDHPVYYYIDFHKTFGSSKIERQMDKKAFAKKFQKNGLQPIYAKHNMFVFTSKKSKDISIPWEERDDIATGPFKWLSLIAFFISLACLTLFSKYLFNASFDKFMSYGITITYIGVILLFITTSLRNYLSFHHMSIFHSKIKNNNPHFSIKALKLQRIIYHVLAVISVITVFGGIIEDVFNQQSFDPQQHQVIQLSDFKITDESSLSTQSYSSFTIPHSYISLEEVKDGDDALYVKEFEFSSTQTAKKRFQQMKDLPHLYAGNRAEIKDSILYGYYNDQLVSVTLLHDEAVTIIIPTFELTQENINIITEFYQ